MHIIIQVKFARLNIISYISIMKTDIIYPSEKSVLKDMQNNNIKSIVLYVTAYVDHSNYQQYGYTVNNINSDYYFNQKCIENKTKEFSI